MSFKPKNKDRNAKGPGTRPSKPQGTPRDSSTLPTPAVKPSPSTKASARAKGPDHPREPRNTGTRKRPTLERRRSFYLECNQIAPLFAIQRTEATRCTDAALVLAISEPSNIIQSIDRAKRDWNSVREHLSRGPFIRARHGANASPAARNGVLVVKHSKWFLTFDQYKDMPGRVRDWFAKTIADPDLVAARADVDLNSIEEVASHAGQLTLGALIFKKRRDEKQLVDIGVIRYPYPREPYLKFYRIELTAWYESTIILGYTFDTNGVTARINVEEFEPSGPAAPSRRPTDNRLAVAQADALFA